MAPLTADQIGKNYTYYQVIDILRAKHIPRGSSNEQRNKKAYVRKVAELNLDHDEIDAVLEEAEDRKKKKVINFLDFVTSSKRYKATVLGSLPAGLTNALKDKLREWHEIFERVDETQQNRVEAELTVLEVRAAEINEKEFDDLIAEVEKEIDDETR
ncbi:hypothetical protein EK21DRAFT_87995 [Setomelanomma holmii]|uniref:Uncharacterized protein n=1 Tax=Setomelanomma holmii TaxID=210430 RepID=A0A9P4HBE2_9PLEO|nr:hypothetical protein EK21DRAFT_87995 [Setomelanomma holmii]